MDSEAQWRRALDGLRARRPWCRLAPGTLASVAFGPAVTVYDLLSSDRRSGYEQPSRPAWTAV